LIDENKSRIIHFMTHQCYIVAGPTASGKSNFACELARKINGIIINCDSVQIYKGMENISASPLPEGLDKIVPHKLFSILPLTEQISVSDYLELARTEYNTAINAGHPVVFVGGTGFYINAILKGMSPVPEISNENRDKARAIVQEYPDAAKKLLINADSKFDSFDPQRMARALEVFLETGRPLSEWQSLPRKGAIAPDALKIFINPHKDILISRIAKRVPIMIENGSMDEARTAIQAGWNLNRAIGASEAARFIRGEISKSEMMQNWIIRTNQYAKRQRTWFRHQFGADIEIGHIPTNTDLENVLQK
jgi:tRNA dimethylallyltransferase